MDNKDFTVIVQKISDLSGFFYILILPRNVLDRIIFPMNGVIAPSDQLTFTDYL